MAFLMDLQATLAMNQFTCQVNIIIFLGIFYWRIFFSHLKNIRLLMTVCLCLCMPASSCFSSLFSDQTAACLPFYMALYHTVRLCTWLFICLHIALFVCVPSIYLSIVLSVCVPFYLFQLFICLSIVPYLCLSLYLPIYPTVHLSAFSSDCPSDWLIARQIGRPVSHLIGSLTVIPSLISRRPIPVSLFSRLGYSWLLASICLLALSHRIQLSPSKKSSGRMVFY